MASPLYTAPIAEWFTARTALAGSTSMLHPAIVPSSVANSSVPGALLPFAEMTKPVVALLTTPVGADAPEPPGAGMVIVPGATGCPVPSRLVDFPDPFSDIQSPLLSPKAIPHGLTRFESVLFAIPGTSETRFVCVNVGAVTVAGRRRGATTIIVATAAAARSI